MSTRASYILALMIVTAVARGLSQNPVDVFPLGVGNSWTYDYEYCYSCFSSAHEGSSERDSGTIVYRVVDATTDPDMATWLVLVRCNVRSEFFSFVPPVDSVWTIQDSTFIYIYEELLGAHKISASTLSPPYNPIWIFHPLFSDSLQIYRFRTPDSTGQYTLDARCDFEVPKYYRFVFKPDSGLTFMSDSSRGPSGQPDEKARALLIEFTPTSAIATAVGPPQHFWLYQNYPNPFNGQTFICYSLPTFTHVSLTLYDLLGREVTVLLNHTEQAGNKRVCLDASGLPTGVYFYRLVTSDYVKTRNLIILK
jgi:hypothetical protein